MRKNDGDMEIALEVPQPRLRAVPTEPAPPDDFPTDAELLARVGERLTDDLLMAQVHAIELSDRDDRFAPSCGHLIKALPAVHDSPALLSPTQA